MSYAEYETEIRLLSEDLGLAAIGAVEPTWAFYRRTSLPRSKPVGLATIVTDGNNGNRVIRAKIEIASGYPRPQVINTIAHELRHLWQRTSGTHQRRERGYYWSGTQFYPRAVLWTRGSYGSEPQEIDAREYARSATLRLFGFDTRINEVAEEVVASLFRSKL